MLVSKVEFYIANQTHFLIVNFKRYMYISLYLYVYIKARHQQKFQQPLQKVVNSPKTPKNRVINFSRPSTFL